MDSFINQKYIEDLLEDSKNANNDFINTALNKADIGKVLKHKEIAALLTTKNPEHINRIFESWNPYNLEQAEPNDYEFYAGRFAFEHAGLSESELAIKLYDTFFEAFNGNETKKTTYEECLRIAEKILI